VASLAFCVVLKLAFYVVRRQAYSVEPPIWAQIEVVRAQWWNFQAAKPLLCRGRRLQGGHRLENAPKTSAVQRKRRENGPDPCRVWAKVALPNALKTMGTIRTQ
jgi:hypothetical protein